MKAKLTCYVAPDVLKALKLAAVDADLTQGAIVEAALRAELLSPKRGRSDLARDTLERGPGSAMKRARSLRKDGSPLTTIAAELNRLGYCTARGKRWTETSVSRLLSR